MSKVTITDNGNEMDAFIKQSFGGPDDPNASLWKYVTNVDYPDRQIIRFDGKDKFIEFMTEALPIDRIKVYIRNYDQKKPKGQRIGKSFEYYLSIYETLRLCESISSGRLLSFIAREREVYAAKQSNKESYYMRDAWSTFGGTNAIDLAKRGKKRPDGKSVFRKLTIKPSTLNGYEAVLQIECGPGKTGEHNGFMPDYKSVRELKGDDGYLMIPLSKANLAELAEALKLHIYAYTSAKYSMVSDMQITNYFKAYTEIEMAKQNKMMKILYEHIINLEKTINELSSQINAGVKLPNTNHATGETINHDTIPMDNIMRDTQNPDEITPF